MFVDVDDTFVGGRRPDEGSDGDGRVVSLFVVAQILCDRNIRQNLDGSSPESFYGFDEFQAHYFHFGRELEITVSAISLKGTSRCVISVSGVNSK